MNTETKILVMTYAVFILCFLLYISIGWLLWYKGAVWGQLYDEFVETQIILTGIWGAMSIFIVCWFKFVKTE